jgi:hypothetical protein
LKSSSVVGILVLLAGVIVFLLVSILIGIILIAVGAIMIYFRRRNASRRNQTGPAMSPSMAPSPTTVVQPGTTTVACKYCGTFNDRATAKVCSNCGAPLT